MAQGRAPSNLAAPGLASLAVRSRCDTEWAGRAQTAAEAPAGLLCSAVAAASSTEGSSAVQGRSASTLPAAGEGTACSTCLTTVSPNSWLRFQSSRHQHTQAQGWNPAIAIVQLMARLKTTPQTTVREAGLILPARRDLRSGSKKNSNSRIVIWGGFSDLWFRLTVGRPGRNVSAHLTERAMWSTPSPLRQSYWRTMRLQLGALSLLSSNFAPSSRQGDSVPWPMRSFKDQNGPVVLLSVLPVVLEITTRPCSHHGCHLDVFVSNS